MIGSSVPSGSPGGMARKPRQDREVATVFRPCLSGRTPAVFPFPLEPRSPLAPRSSSRPSGTARRPRAGSSLCPPHLPEPLRSRRNLHLPDGWKKDASPRGGAVRPGKRKTCLIPSIGHRATASSGQRSVPLSPSLASSLKEGSVFAGRRKKDAALGGEAVHRARGKHASSRPSEPTRRPLAGSSPCLSHLPALLRSRGNLYLPDRGKRMLRSGGLSTGREENMPHPVHRSPRDGLSQAAVCAPLTSPSLFAQGGICICRTEEKGCCAQGGCPPGEGKTCLPQA